MTNVNTINYDYFKKKEKEEIKSNVIYAFNINDQIALIKNSQSFYYEYSGFKIIKCLNTNKAIKEMLYKDNIYSNIKMNDTFLKQKDIILISPFTKISDILSSRINANLHNWLKQNELMNINIELENFVSSKLQKFENDLEQIVDYDFSKCDLIHFLNIKDEFISESNIEKIFNILKTFDKKFLIIFNDINYLSYESLSKYFQFFNFLYFVNSIDEDYKIIQDFDDYLIEFDIL
ncbi:hypothetical protein ACJA28_00335 [Mesomycoplasma moatsii]|uniref:hypothetical protein n=1 Tax=Mesomycoplasma moatsii TaxID=171287 RepID=UPI0003B6A19A